MDSIARALALASLPGPVGLGLVSMVTLSTVSSKGKRHVAQWNFATKVIHTWNFWVVLLDDVTVIGLWSTISMPSGTRWRPLQAGQLFVTDVLHAHEGPRHHAPGLRGESVLAPGHLLD
jgi:hypothetical protein